MTKEPYTPEQVETADRLMKAITQVPLQKRPAFVRLIEAMSLGAELADRLASPASINVATNNRPSA